MTMISLSNALPPPGTRLFPVSGTPSWKLDRSPANHESANS